MRRYGTGSEADRAARRIADAVPTGSQSSTFSVTSYNRSDNDRHGLVLPVADYVVQVEAPSAQVVEARFRALGFVRENPDKNPLWVALTDWVGATLGGIAVYAVLYGLMMVRLGSWASQVTPEPAAIPVPLSTLRNRLMAINRLGLPFQVTEVRHGRFVAEWRIVDAKWLGLMQAGGLRSVHSLHIDLDERQVKARVLDKGYTVRWETDGMRLKSGFSFFRGITFAQFERGWMAGLLYDRQTGWSVREGYNYRFNLAEMKAPLTQAVMQSGWTWQPVVTFFRPIGG